MGLSAPFTRGQGKAHEAGLALVTREGTGLSLAFRKVMHSQACSMEPAGWLESKKTQPLLPWGLWACQLWFRASTYHAAVTTATLGRKRVCRALGLGWGRPPLLMGPFLTSRRCSPF